MFLVKLKLKKNLLKMDQSSFLTQTRDKHQIKMAATIEQIVNLLEKANPEDTINVSASDPAFWKAHKVGERQIKVAKHEDWDYIVLDKGFTKVQDVLRVLKELVPGFKDRHVGLYFGSGITVLVATAKITETKLLTLDFSKETRHLPKFVEQTRKEALDKFTEMMRNFNKSIGSSFYSPVPLAQHFITQHPELEPLYLVGTTFYPSFSDVQTAYPELAVSQTDDLFKPCDHGVFVCSYTSDELKNMFKRKPQYVSDVGTFSREELLEKFKLTDVQIDNLFIDKDGVLTCAVDGLLETLARVSV